MNKEDSIEQINQNEEQRKFLNGKWSKSEHERFLKGFSAFGRNWSEVQKLVKTRSLAQVRSHAQKHFLKTKEEEDDSCEMSLYSDSEDFFQKSKELLALQSRLSLKKTKLTNQTSPSSEKSEFEVKRKQEKESLLDIFKQAIEQFTLQIENESQEANYQYERTLEKMDKVKEESKEEEVIEREKKCAYFENIYGSWKVLC